MTGRAGAPRGGGVDGERRFAPPTFSRRIGWISPVARASMGKSVGDTATVPMPKGAETIETVAIEYPG
jgi:transcription elongation GreA/GreB family factor